MSETKEKKHYWVIERGNSEHHMTIVYAGTDKADALKLLWTTVEASTLFDTISKEVIPKIKEAVLEQSRFFRWTWNGRGHYFCAYILEGEKNKCTDTIDVDALLLNPEKWYVALSIDDVIC